MRLDPKKVRFVPQLFHLGLSEGALRFVGKENTVHLQETALVVEGNLLKVGLLGLEVFFRRALAEWSAITIPYARITKTRFVRFPAMRIIALTVLAACFLLPAIGFMVNPVIGLTEAIVAVIPALLALYVALRVPARYVIQFRSRNGRRTKLMFRITSTPLRKDFARRLGEYREAADRYADQAGAVPGPDPILTPRPSLLWVGVLVGVFAVLEAGLAVVGYVAFTGMFLGQGNGPADDSGQPNPFAGLTSGPTGASSTTQITPESIRKDLVGRQFGFKSQRGVITGKWRVDPGEIKDVRILANVEQAVTKSRRVEAMVHLEAGQRKLRGVLVLTYLWAGDRWLLLDVVPKDAGPGKSFTFEVPDKN
jgi:hypothetical protein